MKIKSSELEFDFTALEPFGKAPGKEEAARAAERKLLKICGCCGKLLPRYKFNPCDRGVHGTACADCVSRGATRQCPRCGKDKPADRFGSSSVCRECRAEYRKGRG